MKFALDRSRVIPLVALVALMAAGVHTSIDNSRTAFDPNSAMTMAALLSPLVVVALAVATGRNKDAAFFAAYLAIAVGGFIESAYYVSRDPSKGMLLAISLSTYWLCGVIALCSFGGDRSPP